MTKLNNAIFSMVLGACAALTAAPAKAGYELELKVGQSQSTVLYTYFRDTCHYGALGSVDIKNPENGVLTAVKGSTKVDSGAYCIGKTMKGWKITLKATAKGRSCGYVAVNAPSLNGSAIGSTRYPFCLTVK